MPLQLAGEAALRDGKVAYTIVRPGRFTGQPGTAKIIAGMQMAHISLNCKDLAVCT